MDSLGDDDRRPARTSRIARIAVPFGALALLLAGSLLAITGTGQESFGWFAYAPLSSQAFLPDGIFFLSARTKAGLVLAGVGLLALTFWAGHRVGRRRS
jgi:heme/copper-type cytochrome/quinol oxidase subunit 1